jgi:hypothetical protein
MIKAMNSAGEWTETQISEHERNMLTILINDSKAEHMDE